MTEARQIEVRVSKLDVDEMPTPSLLVSFASAVPISIPIPIRPGSRAGDVVRGQIIAIIGEHGGDLRPNCSLEKSIGDQGDDLVPLIAPGECRSR